MTWEGYWLPRLVDWIIGAAISGTVAAIVGLLVRRWLRGMAVQLGLVPAPALPARRLRSLLPSPYGAARRLSRETDMGIRGKRKAIAAGFGVLLIGLLEWVTTSTVLEHDVEQLVPPQLVPLVPVVIGGLATVLAVYRASNATTDPASTIVEPAPPAEHGAVLDAVHEPAGTVPAVPVASPLTALTVAGAAGVPIVDAPAWWGGIRAGEPSASTSLVDLQPINTVPSYL